MQAALGLSIVVAALMVSGCIAAESAQPPGPAGANEVPEAAAPAQFDETTGAISGTVINDEGLPVGGAVAGILETSQQTTADVAGSFTFSNLAPGDYSLVVQQLGYESVARRVSVLAGEVSHQNIVLSQVAIEEAYHEILVQNGNVQCSVRAYPGVPTTTMSGLPPWVTGVAVCGLVSLPGFAPDRFLINYDVSAGAVEILAEMEWSSTQATGSALGVVLEHAGHPNDLDYTFGQMRGRSPLVVHANVTTVLAVQETSGIDCIADGCRLTTRVFAEAETTGIKTPVPLGPFPDPLGDPADRVDFGLTLDQRFVQYLTLFHLDPMPDGFSALADG